MRIILVLLKDHPVSRNKMVISTGDHFQEGNASVLGLHLGWSKSILYHELSNNLG